MDKSNFSKEESKISLTDVYRVTAQQAYKYLIKHRKLLKNEDYLNHISTKTQSKKTPICY